MDYNSVYQCIDLYNKISRGVNRDNWMTYKNILEEDIFLRKINVKSERELLLALKIFLEKKCPEAFSLRSYGKDIAKNIQNQFLVSLPYTVDISKTIVVVKPKLLKILNKIVPNFGHDYYVMNRYHLAFLDTLKNIFKSFNIPGKHLHITIPDISDHKWFLIFLFPSVFNSKTILHKSLCPSVIYPERLDNFNHFTFLKDGVYYKHTAIPFPPNDPQIYLGSLDPRLPFIIYNTYFSRSQPAVRLSSKPVYNEIILSYPVTQKFKFKNVYITHRSIPLYELIIETILLQNNINPLYKIEETSILLGHIYAESDFSKKQLSKIWDAYRV